MPSVDVKWPSEDEEFDTVATATATRPEKKPEDNQDGESIAVNFGQPTASEPSLTPEASSEAQAESAPETATEAPQLAENASGDQETPELSAAAQAEETPSVPEDNKEEKTDVPKPENVVPAAVAAAPVVTAVTAKGGKKGGKFHFGHILGYVVLIALVAGLAYWAFGLNSENKELKTKVSTLESQVTTLNNNPAIVEQRKTDELVAKVGALMELPQNERPQAALVSDAASLKKQYPFFANVANGDQILFYYQAGKVIVYRPSTNKVVQTGPLTISQATTATSAPKR